ncbi:MAG: DUF2061 domain-containing protein [Bacteroidia bacterium]
MKDSRTRSLVKGISWRCLGTLDTLVISYIVFGNISHAASIAGTEVVTKIVLYYFHERIWNIVKWGRLTKRASHIRSIVKGLSWRTLGTLDTILISYFYTSNPMGALQVGVTEVVTKVILYYVHERIWGRIKWGRKFPEGGDPGTGGGMEKTGENVENVNVNFKNILIDVDGKIKK